MIAVFATIRARPGRRDELIEVLRPLIEEARREPGTLVWAMHADVTDEDLLHYYELYESKAAFVAHTKVVGPKLNALANLIVGPPELNRATLIESKGLPIGSA